MKLWWDVKGKDSLECYEIWIKQYARIKLKSNI